MVVIFSSTRPVDLIVCSVNGNCCIQLGQSSNAILNRTSNGGKFCLFTLKKFNYLFSKGEKRLRKGEEKKRFIPLKVHFCLHFLLRCHQNANNVLMECDV